MSFNSGQTMKHLSGFYEKSHLSEFMFQQQFRQNNRVLGGVG